MCFDGFGDVYDLVFFLCGDSDGDWFHSFSCTSTSFTSDYRLCDRVFKSRYGLRYAFLLIVDSGTCYQQIGSGFDYQRSGRLVNAAIDFDIAVQAAFGNHLAQAGDFGQRFGDELLAAEAGVDGHDKHHVDQGEYIFEQEDGGRWVERDCCHFARYSDLLDDAVQVRANLLVDDNHAGSGLCEILDVSFGVGNHQVGFEREPGAAAHRLDDHWPHCNIGDEMAVHDIDLDALAAPCLGLVYLFAEAGEVGGKYGGYNTNHIKEPLSRIYMNLLRNRAIYHPCDFAVGRTHDLGGIFVGVGGAFDDGAQGVCFVRARCQEEHVARGVQDGRREGQAVRRWLGDGDGHDRALSLVQRWMVREERGSVALWPHAKLEEVEIRYAVGAEDALHFLGVGQRRGVAVELVCWHTMHLGYRY